MASRTQLRLGQITGSFGDAEGKIVDNLPVAATLAAIPARSGSMVSAMSELASSIQRIHGGTAFTTQAEGVFAARIQVDNETEASTTTNGSLQTDGGLSVVKSAVIGDNLSLLSDDAILNFGAGNDVTFTHDGEATSGMDVASVGAFDIAAGAASTFSTSAGALTVDSAAATLVLDGHTGVTIDASDSGAVEINAAAGAIEIGNDDIAQAINIGTDGARTITIGDESAGNTTAINIKARGAASSDISIESAAGSVNITAAENAADSVKITGVGVQILSSDVTNGLKLATGTSGVPVTIGNGTSEVTVQDNLTVSGDATVAGSLTVQGTVSTIDTTNSTIKDALIVLNSGSAADPTNADAGIIFAQPDVSRALFVDATDSRIFKFANTYTSGSDIAVDISLGLADVALKKVFFHDTVGEHITGDGTNMTLSSGAKINLTATSDVHIPEGVGLIFDTAGTEKIESDGTDLTVASAGNIILDAETDIELNANGADIIFKDHTTEVGRLIHSANFILSSSAGKDLAFDSNSGTFPLQVGGTEYANIMLDPGLILSSSTGNDITIDSNSGKVFLSKESGGAGAKNTAVYISGSTGLENLRIAPSDKSYSAASTITGDYFVDFSFGNVYNNNVLGVSGSVKILSDNGGGGVNLKAPTIPGADVNLTLPTGVGNANDVLITNGSGVLSFSSVSSLVAPTKAIKIIGAAGVAAEADFFTNADMVSGVTIVDLSLAESQGKSLDVYVNGQLLLSGSAGQAVPGGDRDYSIASVNTLKFAFDLELDDIVQIIKR